MRTRYKLGIFVALQPFIMLFDRFLYLFLYVGGLDLVQIGMLDIVYSLIAAVTLFLIGNYADITGRKKMVPLLIGYFSIFPFLYIRFRSFISAIFLRFFDAFKQPYFPLYKSIVQDLTPKKRAGMYFGFVTAIWGISWLVMVLFAGFVIEIFGFEILAFANIIFITVFAIFFMKFFPETRSGSEDKFRRISLKIIKNKFILAYCVYQIIIYYTIVVNWIYLPIKSYDVTSSFISVGIILLAGQIMFALGQIPFGILADKVGMIKVYVVGMIIASIMSFFLGFVNQGILLIVVNFFAGVGKSLAAPAEQALVTENIPEKRRAEFNGLIQFVSEFGILFAVILATIVIVLSNIDYVFYIQSIIFLIAPLAFLIPYKISKKS